MNPRIPVLSFGINPGGVQNVKIDPKELIGNTSVYEWQLDWGPF